MQMRIFIIKNCFMVFQSILQHDLWPSIFLMLSGEIWHFHRKVWHLLAQRYSECFEVRPAFVFVFPLPLKDLQNMVFERFNSILCRRKSWPTNFFLICWNKNGPSQGSTADDSSIQHFARSKRRWFEPMYESSHCHDSSSLIPFSNFSADFRQTNCGAPHRLNRPTILKWNNRHMISFAKETGEHLLRSASCTNNFGFGSFSKRHDSQSVLIL